MPSNVSHLLCSVLRSHADSCIGQLANLLGFSSVVLTKLAALPERAVFAVCCLQMYEAAARDEEQADVADVQAHPKGYNALKDQNCCSNLGAGEPGSGGSKNG